MNYPGRHDRLHEAPAPKRLWPRLPVVQALVVSTLLQVIANAQSTIYVNRYFEVRQHEQPVKYVFSGDQRVATVTGSLSGSPRVQRLQLDPGWNLRSIAVDGAVLPLAGADPTTEGIVAAYRLNVSTEKWEQLAINETLAAGTVLWVFASAHLNLGLGGAYETPTNQAVAAGNTFLGTASLEVRPTPSVDSGVNVWGYDGVGHSWLLQAPDLPEPTNGVPWVLAPGEAIFVSSAIPFEWPAPKSAVAVRYYHPDHLGSSTAMTDASGELLEETAFYPHGVVRNEHRLQPIEEAYKYTQKERDSESGLVYFGARYLVSALGRFASVDPLYVDPPTRAAESSAGSRNPGFYDAPQIHNLYALAAGNPIKFTDPGGMDVTWAKGLQKDKAFQRAYKILEGTKEGKRILAALESADVEVKPGKLPDRPGADGLGHHHGSLSIQGSKRNMRVTAKSAITIDLAKIKKHKLTSEEFANVLHHELRHAEILNTRGPNDDFSTDEGTEHAQKHMKRSDSALDVYLPHNTPFKSGTRRGTGVQNLDDRNIEFQKEVGLLPQDYLQGGQKSAPSGK
jgi:RHS repeat-associated protein